MADERSYLDHNASAPLRACARTAMLSALDNAANASSVHAEGRAVRRLVERARREVATLVDAAAEHVVFTSGATEAANMLLTPDWRMGRAPLTMGRLYVSAADHPCMLSGGRFAGEAVETFAVRSDGLVDLDALAAVLAAHDGSTGLALVAVHAANNETGVIQPVGEIARLVKDAGGVLVVDAVQAVGRIPVDIAEGWGDFLILSSHKLGGPKGAGAIVGRSDLMMPAPLMSGGGQEKGHRAGTENVAAIAGFGAAAAESLSELENMTTVRQMRDDIEAAIRHSAPDAIIHGTTAPRLPNTSFFSLPESKAETLQIAFDLQGVALSAGSACSSGKVGPSHVLKAMGQGEEATALRVSIGTVTTQDDVVRFRRALAEIADRQARKRSRAA
ncbi:cysteine desulfurase family protein [Mesorhizobium xinjiangense]|uniref:cysteine desulfurase family protein n=1 Tax=Mesorhizobium xinjiangense TaxID=2678685 RepID=UPI0012EDDA56|nr:cysteine desulfurase family protein [Mesorhizobium xinjiangense]